MRYLIVLDTLEFKSIFKVRCMTTDFVYYVRAKYFAGHYKKFDLITIDGNNNNENFNLGERYYEQE